MSINSNSLRIGNFTSSEIEALASEGQKAGSIGKPYYTYIEECNMERSLLRSISSETWSKETVWGEVCEPYAFDFLDTSYALTSRDTIAHPLYPFWVGTKDAIKYDPGKTVADIKCPFTLKSFCQFIEYFKIGGIDEIRKRHKQGEKYYWQLVSNAILDDCKYAELIVFCPYQQHLDDVRHLARNIDSPDKYKYNWLAGAKDSELPYILVESKYEPLNTLRWEVNPNDKDFLTERVKEAGKLLR